MARMRDTAMRWLAVAAKLLIRELAVYIQGLASCRQSLLAAAARTIQRDLI